MKNTRYCIGFIVICSILSSCVSNTKESSIDRISVPEIEFNTVDVNGLYAMKIPKFMTVTTTLQEGASLQYNNPFKGKYVTILDENKSELRTLMKTDGVMDASQSNLENYVDMRLVILKDSGISISSQTIPRKKKINGLEAYSIVVEGTSPEISERVAYFFTFLEGEKHFYTIKSWTLLDRKVAYAYEVEEMINSFKEF